MGYKSNSPQVHSPEVLESQLANSKCVCAAIEQQKNRQDGDASQGVQYLRRSDYRYTRRYAVSQPAPPPRIGSTLTIFSCHQLRFRHLVHVRDQRLSTIPGLL